MLRKSSKKKNDLDEKVRSLLLEKDAKIQAMQNEIMKLTNTLQQTQSAGSETVKRRHHPLTAFSTTIQEVNGGQNGNNMQQVRSRMGRHASISTSNVLNSLPSETEDTLALRIVDMFKNPNQHLAYLKSEQFAHDILMLSKKVKPVFEDEPRCIFLQSPCYVFGDIHGNLEDLHFFSDNIWRLGMSLTAGNFLFLGDYVDRGLSCLEVVAYLMAMKLLLPHKVFMLRGNHETRDVNGWEEHYGERSYIYQCRERFGEDMGYRIWEETNQVFDRMPLAAVIDQDIFCVHGGIPRGVSHDSQIQDILSVPKIAGINPPYEHESEEYQQVASDCIWSDPASDEQEACGVDPQSGFGESLRGGGAICFGHRAVTNFLQQHGYSYIMRAHEAHAEGVAVSKGARVFTVFSTSKDHNQGSQAMAGCILVDFEKMHVINRSPAYKNKFVHRRDSISLAGMNENEIADRIKLGLVTAADEGLSDDDDDDDVSSYSSTEESFSNAPNVPSSNVPLSALENSTQSHLQDVVINDSDDDDMQRIRTESEDIIELLKPSSYSGDELIIATDRRSSVNIEETVSSPGYFRGSSDGGGAFFIGGVADEGDEVVKKPMRRLSGVMEDDENENEDSGTESDVIDSSDSSQIENAWESAEWRSASASSSSSKDPSKKPSHTPPSPNDPVVKKKKKKKTFWSSKK